MKKIGKFKMMCFKRREFAVGNVPNITACSYQVFFIHEDGISSHNFSMSAQFNTNEENRQVYAMKLTELNLDNDYCRTTEASLLFFKEIHKFKDNMSQKKGIDFPCQEKLLIAFFGVDNFIRETKNFGYDEFRRTYREELKMI